MVADWDPFANPILAEDNGIVHFEDIIDGWTVAEQYDELTGLSKLVVNEYIAAGYKPAILVKSANDKIKKLNKDKELNDDESKKAQDEIQKITDSYVIKADTTFKTKEAEILKV